MKKLNSKNNWLPNIFNSSGKEIKPLKKQSLSVLEQIKEEKLSQNDDLYWESRPTRLFWLDSEIEKELYNEERRRLIKVLKFNYYDKKKLEEYFKSQYDDEALDKIKNTPNQNPGVYFPIKIKSNNKYLPLVSFSGFTKVEESIYFEKPIIALKNKLKLEINEKLIPEISLYDELDGKSYDLAFVTNILLDNHKHLFNSLPKICCTGIVDENGNIKVIEFAKEKFEASKQMGFDYILLPYENKEDIIESENVIFFKNILELDNWLIELAWNKAKKQINYWLSIGGETPTQKEFNSYFEATLNRGVSYWQHYLKYVPTDIAIEKIHILLNKYLNYIEEENIENKEDKLFRQVILLKNKLPTYRYYSLIPKLINILKNYNKITDYLYSQINEVINSQNPDLAIATKIVRESQTINEIANNQNLREKYPQLLCFYYKHPTELIYILSCIPELTEKEKKLINAICEHIDNNKTENEILNTAFNILKSNNNYHYEITTEPIPHSYQLALLEKAIENFYNKNKEKYSKSLENYKIIIKSILINVEKADEQKIRIINRLKKFENNFKKEICNNNLQEDIKLNNLYSNQILDNSFPLGINSKLYSFLQSNNYNLEEKLKNKIVINHSKTTFNSYRNRYLSDFCTNLNIGKMSYLIAECIAFFFGKYVVKTNSLQELKILTQSEYDLPFSIGLLSQNFDNSTKDYYSNNVYPKICSLILDFFTNKKFTLRQLMWLYLLKDCYKNIIARELEKYLSIKFSSLKENSEFKREFEFIVSLFDLSKDYIIYNNFENDAWNSINSKNTLTRTEQLLYPILIFLKYNKSKIFEFKMLGSQLNNSRFVVEFLRAFGKDADLNELFIPIHGFSEFEKQLFEAMTIIRLDQEKEYYSLKNYALNNITNINNLKFALELLEGK